MSLSSSPVDKTLCHYLLSHNGTGFPLGSLLYVCLGGAGMKRGGGDYEYVHVYICRAVCVGRAGCGCGMVVKCHV